MESNHRGRRSIVFPQPPAILAYASVAGKKEAQGPLRASFDLTSDDTSFGQKTWEKAETQMQKQALRIALNKAKLEESAKYRPSASMARARPWPRACCWRVWP